ncbi:prepilin-type N-terminal cleavage/methylation domain-containing protein [Saccharococcus sp. Marseille-Q5394]|uniref:prepilin-type N-terminal cleavage/methylation domain-containing protein n=1 Tax=Saccharococcus sp. Marseille-Q5394 TaxID=2972778 RepID=UPI0021C88D3E|nr:prepilin-type N-terminal cleavage/methylation domain-containing protein [Saccharococcus sp. Marseille-Q5394]
MLRKQNGMTLVEVLAVLVLSSLVILLIWTTVMTAIKYNITETKKLRMQEEANYIITEIQRIHRQCSQYELNVSAGEISMKSCDGPISDRVISRGYNYNGTIYVKDKIDAKKKDASIPFTLVMNDLENDRLEVEITTTISRYKLN